jgi:hypothetical protein
MTRCAYLLNWVCAELHKWANDIIPYIPYTPHTAHLVGSICLTTPVMTSHPPLTKKKGWHLMNPPRLQGPLTPCMLPTHIQNAK